MAEDLAVRRAVFGMMAAHRFQEHKTIGGHTIAEKEKLAQEVEEYKQEAERVCLLSQLHETRHLLMGRIGGRKSSSGHVVGVAMSMYLCAITL